MLNIKQIVAIFIVIFTAQLYADEQTITLPETSRSADQMTKQGAAFLESLDDEQRQAVIFNFDDDTLRGYWSNAPIDSKARNGLPIGRFSLEQRDLLHQLLIASTSSQGYYKIWAAVRGDDALKMEGENRELSSTKFFGKNQSLGAINYWVSFYGDPRTDQRWGYMITGHHLAANFTVVDGKATFTPMFYGADPGKIHGSAHAGHVFLPQERKRGYELLQSLDDEQRKMAIIVDKFPENKFGATDFLGPGKKDVPIAQRGIRADQLTEVQQKLLWVLIEEYVRNADFDVADEQLSLIKADGLEQLYFLWMGTTDESDGTDEDKRIFFRVHGPHILIDFVDQRTEFDWNTHPHTIVRDPSNDYGQAWLGRHLKEYHDKDSNKKDDMQQPPSNNEQSVQKQNEQDVQKQVEEIERKRIQAMLDKDITTLRQIVAQDCVHITTSGHVRTGTQYLNEFEKSPPNFVHFRVKTANYDVHPGVVVVTGNYENAKATEDTVTPIKQAVFTRVYRLREGQWWLVKHQATAISSKATESSLDEAGE